MASSFGISPASRTGRPVRSFGTSHLLVLGAVDLVCGIVALIWPGVTILVLALIFGLLLLLAGALALAVGAAARRGGLSPVLAWTLGAVAIVAGVVCLAHPGAGVWAIVLGVAFWFLMTGLGDLLVASATPAHRWWFVLLGALSIVAAVVLLVHPGVAIVTVSLVAGIWFLVRGGSEIVLGLMLRRSGR